MKKFLLIISFALLSYWNTSAQRVSYSYDTSGNRSSKTLVGAASKMSSSEEDDPVFEKENTESKALSAADLAVDELSAEARAQIDAVLSSGRVQASNALKGVFNVPGAIPIQPSVSQSGGRLYTIPISTAAGYGITPQIALTYASQAGDGVAGYGWSISGVSSIEIIDKNQYYHGTIAPANANSAGQAFMLDGQPLVQSSVSGYDLETAHGHILVKIIHSTDNHPCAFKAFYPDGSVRQFGLQYDSAYRATFPETTATDRFGNVMKFTYSWQNNIPRLDEIRYGSSGAMHGNIFFTYEQRDVQVPRNRACQGTSQSQLLKSIVSRDSTTVIGAYSLSHFLVSGSYLLTQVGFSRGTTALNPLTFTYGPQADADDVVLRSAGRLNRYFPYSPDNFTFKRGKFIDGSYEDGVVVYPDMDQLSPYQLILIYHSKIDGPGYVNCLSAENDFESVEIADCDGDGTDEIIRINASNVAEAEHYNHSKICFTRLRYDNAGQLYHDSDSVWVMNHFSPTFGIDRDFFSGDFIGNGRQYLAYVESIGNFTSGTCYFNIIDVENASIICNQAVSDMTRISLERMFMADIDSDGKCEICIPKSNGLNIYTVTESGMTGPRLAPSLTTDDFDGRGEVLFADFNSDGYLDLLVAPEKKSRPRDSQWKYFKYNGIYFSSGSVDICKNYEDDEFCLIDIDKDGLTDLVRKHGNTVTVYPFKELGFQISQSYVSSARLGSDEHIVPCESQFATGYGKHRASDFITMNRDTVKYYCSVRDISSERQLLVVSDSYGALTADEYQDISLDSSTAYFTDGTREYSIEDGLKRQRVPLRVLTSSATIIDDPSAGSYSFLALESYSYRDAVFSTQGLGFLGFGGMTVRDNLQGTVTDQRNDPSLFGMPTDVVVSLASSTGSPVSETHNTYDRHSTTYGKLSPRLVSSSTVDHLTGNVSSTDVVSYDSYDNPLVTYATAITADAAVPDTVLTRTETRYDNVITSGRSILGLPRWQRSTTTRKGPSVIDGYDSADNGITLTEYDPRSLLPVKVQTFASCDTLTATPASVTLYTYNTHGRMSSERSAAYGASQPEAFVGDTCTYTPDGRFPASSTDALGRTTTYSDYNIWGKPESVTDHRGNTVEYTYDALGRQTAVSRPDGSSETTVYSWYGSGTGAWQVTVAGSDGSSTTTRYDAAGRVTSTSTLTFDGATRTVARTYDQKGRPSTETLPYLAGGASAAPRHRLSYDAYGRRTRDDLLASGSASAPVVKSSVTSYSGASVTTSLDGVTSTKYMSAGGEVLLARDAGGDIRYRYDGRGQLRELIACSAYGANLADTTRLSYDIYGRRISIDDSSAGLRTDSYTTNADGSSVTVHTTPAGTTTTYTDRYGRTTRTVTTGPGGFTTDYAYDSVDGSLPVSVTSDNGSSATYGYDSLGRLCSSRETTPGGRWLEKTVSYSSTTGQVDSVSYRSHRGHIDTERMTYSHGVASKVTADGGLTVMELLSENALGQPTSVRTGTVTRSYGFDAFGLPTSRTMGTVQDFSYTISPQTGNLSSRTDGTRSISESFYYDNLDRLIMATDSGFDNPGAGTPANPIRYTYSANGNRTFASYVGNVQYSNPESPYRATSLAPYSGMDPGQNQLMVMYSAYDRPLNVNLPAEVYNYVYNAGGERVQMTNIIKASGPALTRHWMDGGRYEIDSTSTCVKEIFYLGGSPYSASMAKVREDGGAWTVYNIGRDYQGSITHIATTGGALVAEYSYDPWGRMRDPGTHVNYEWDDVPELLLGRGYTGHEYLAAAGLIIMNARLYDPWLGRFLSPDPYVQAPDFTQSLNRYSYCLNNPLKYTDPSGEIAWFVPIIVGAVLGSMSGCMIGSSTGATGWDMTGYIAAGALIGGLSAGAAVWVSTAGGGAMIAGATAGAVGGAGFSGLATGWDANSMFKGATFGLASGFIGGGVGAAIGGGMGALFGGMASSGLNTALHGGDSKQIITSMLIGGGVSYGTYTLTSYIGWKEGGNILGGHDISYKQYKTMQADYQRSRFYGKEYGGFLLNDGSVQRFPSSWRYSHGITPPNGEDISIPNDAFAMYHTHWDAPNKLIMVNSLGQRVDNSTDISTLLDSSIRQVTTARGHGFYDYISIDSFVINRYETSFNIGGTNLVHNYYDSFLRYFPWYIIL